MRVFLKTNDFVGIKSQLPDRTTGFGTIMGFCQIERACSLQHGIDQFGLRWRRCFSCQSGTHRSTRRIIRRVIPETTTHFCRWRCRFAWRTWAPFVRRSLLFGSRLRLRTILLMHLHQQQNVCLRLWTVRFQSATRRHRTLMLATAYG